VIVHATYSLHPKISVVLAFKFCPTKSVVLACNEIHLIKAMPSTKKTLYWKHMERSKYLVDVTFLVPMHMHSLRIQKNKLITWFSITTVTSN
jgi:hypothetical protein